VIARARARQVGSFLNAEHDISQTRTIYPVFPYPLTLLILIFTKWAIDFPKSPPALATTALPG
jgi:hypothetical protein